MQKNDLRAVVESGEPLVVIVVNQQGLEKAFIFYQEDSTESLEAGSLLLAKISPQFVLIDNALRGRTPTRVLPKTLGSNSCARLC